MKGSRYKTFENLTIPANGMLRVNHYANFIEIIESDATQSLLVVFPDGDGGILPAGLAINLPQEDSFNWVEFQNPTANIVTFTPAFTKGRILDNRFIVPAGTVLDNILGELRGDTAVENWDVEKTVGVAAVEILPANANRKGAIIQAKDSNAGIIYVGFANTVTSSKWVVQLQAGDSWPIDDYRGPLFAIADAAGQLLGWGEW